MAPRSQTTRCIQIQQDGANAHIYNNNAEFLQALTDEGLGAEVITQPANSPDMNLLDFHTVQSANDEVSGGEGQMIEHIQKNQLNMAYLDVLFEVHN